MTTVARPRFRIAADRFDLVRLLSRLRGGDRADAWTRPALAGVAVLAAVIYGWNLAISGFANAYYSAAALAASQSWSAWFFGSFDASNFITVDKPPLSTMLMGLSVRVFGLSSWSILLPEALMGVATVLVLAAAVRRSFGPAAAVIAALVMALTPVAALIFRYNNPDALLTLLLVASAWALLKGIQGGRMRYIVLAAALVGFGFLTKYLQAYLVLPVFALTYAIAAGGTVWRRLAGLAVAAGAVLVASGWWVAIVQLIPATARPFIGGSTNGSVLDLIFGYDGLGRIFGVSGPGGGGAGGGAGFGGASGLFRMFNDEFGGQISWLLPFAAVAFVSGVWIHRRAGRTDRALSGYLLWGGWLAIHVAVFSLMSGIIHPYYAVAMAPAVAALVGAGTVDLWRARARSVIAGIVPAVTVVGTAWWGAQLLGRTPDFLPGLGIAVLAMAVSGALIVALPARLELRRVSIAGLALALAALVAGPAAYAFDTVNTAYSGGTVSAGSSVSGSGFGGGSGPSGFAQPGGTAGLAAPGGAAFGGGANPGQGGSADQSLVDYLVANHGTATWIVAASGSGSAGQIELSSGLPVMAMGGFSGSDPAPTLDQLKAYVSSGQLRFVLLDGGAGGGFGPGGFGARGAGGSSSTGDVSSWVTANCSAVTLTGSSSSSLYDCSAASTTGG